ncbi:MAG: gfo/Idh/MocA family oxidoreductase [Verrucomicrobiaceae bacterium]|jgi:predicted dehydrogenase|nr:MAG: gfo/Idh/MocA family oxidoreductase [Verrucomicrobiaceae bacterium]
MDNRKTNIGVVGAGWWATYAHIPAILSHPGAKLIAVQSRDRAKAEKIARDFNAGHACTGVDELLDIPGLDAVVVSSTPNMHYSQTKAALERGLHVLIEKPMTFTAAEARELVEMAAARNVQLLISCPWHYTAHGIEARRIIAAGELGSIKMISVLMTNPIDKLLKGVNTAPTHGMQDVYVEPRHGSYNDPAIAGGGQVYCQVSHTAAYLTFLTGHRAAEVFARFDNDGSVNDIYDSINIRLENGALVSLASTGATPLGERNYEVRVFGSKGILLMELWRGTMERVDFDGKRREYPPIPAADIYPDQAPALNFIDAIRGTAPNGSSGDLGLASMEIIEAACQSASGAGNIILRPIT